MSIKAYAISAAQNCVRSVRNRRQIPTLTGLHREAFCGGKSLNQLREEVIQHFFVSVVGLVFQAYPFRKPAVQRTGAWRKLGRELDPARVGCLQRASGLRVDAGSCEQSGVCQSVAGIAVAEKNRCLRISAPVAWSVAVRCQSSRLAGTISGTIEGTVGGRVSHDLVYT
jgi:hypothetical protein